MQKLIPLTFQTLVKIICLSCSITAIIYHFNINATRIASIALEPKEQRKCINSTSNQNIGETNATVLYNELESMHRWNVFSERKQDSVLEMIFNYIGTTNKFCIEFGCNNENLNGNTLLLTTKGWNSLLLDGTHNAPDLNLHKEWISRLTINDLFDKYNIPEEPDYLSIDIDSCDLWLFLACTHRYRPRVITVEYNSNFKVGRDKPMTVNCMRNDSDEFRWIGTRLYGASLEALYHAGKLRGYTLMAVEMDLDVFFVRNDLLFGNPPELNVFRKYTGRKMHKRKDRRRDKWEINFAEWTKSHSVDEAITAVEF